MLLKCCCFGNKVTPVNEDIITISLNDSKNNNFVEKVITEIPEPSKPHYCCFRGCFWRKSKNEVSPFVSSPGKAQYSVDRENGLKPVLARQTKYPSAHTNGHGHTSPLPPSSPQPTRFVSPIPSPLAPLAPPSPTPLNTLPPAPSSQSLVVEDLSGDNASEELTSQSRPPSEAKEAEDQIDQVDALVVEEERLNTPPPAPSSPAPPPVAETEPDTTQSEEQLPEEKTPLNKRKFGRNSGKPRLKARGMTKEEKAPLSPELVPFDSPKEALSRCLQQLEQPDWEVTIQGLQTVVRLARHHSAVLSQSLHQVVVAVTKQVKNLRSQVARVACRAATHLFTSVGRGVESLRDMEELCAVLLNRTADTNKFLRADCNSALDAMVDNMSCSKIVSSIVNKGARHQNAVVRGTTCRLLLRLCQRIGPERALSLPRETRDAILNTGARSLTEGSLDTRRYAKEMFVLLSQDQRLPGLLKEVVPISVMRSISKVLARLTAQ